MKFDKSKFIDLKEYFLYYLNKGLVTEEGIYWLLSQKVKIEEIDFFLNRGFEYFKIPDLVKKYGIESWYDMETIFYKAGLILGKPVFQKDILEALENENRGFSDNDSNI